MEVAIVREEPNIYTVKINNSVVINTTLTDGPNMTEWVREVRKIYGKKKKKSQTIAIGLSADHGTNYKNAHAYYSSMDKDRPYEVIQICIGNHCLINDSFNNDTICKALRELLSDNNVIVFGVGMDLAAKKMEKDFGVKLSKTWDLRKLAECAEDLKPGYYGKYNLEKLAAAVLGKEMALVKPDRINWYDVDGVYYSNHLSDDKIKYGTAEAYLAYEMGMKFLQKGTIEAFPEYEKLQKQLRSRYNH